jgi:arylsulfatase
MAYTFSKANADAPTTHHVQYFEMIANRGIYKDGWYANTTPPHGPWILNAPLPPIDQYKWELYDLKNDYSQNDDLAAKMPDKLKAMQALFLQEAKKYNVLPLQNSTFDRAISPRPSPLAGKSVYSYQGVVTGIPDGNSPSILDRSYKITTDVEVPQGGGDGIIVTEGGRFGGYGLYILKGKPVFLYNFLALDRSRLEGADVLTPGKHTIVYDFAYDGPGLGKGGKGTLSVDGKTVATQSIPHTIPLLSVVDESFDVGADTRTGVDDDDYQVPFPFNGTIDNVTFDLGPMQIMSAAEEMKMKKAKAVSGD